MVLEKIDRSPRAASEARIEKRVRIWEARPVGKGKLHLIFVRVADRDHSVARPHWASHPLPFLDDRPFGHRDALPDAGQRFATPVCEFCDQLINAFRWVHWIFMPPILVPFSCRYFYWPIPSKEVVERRGLSTSTAQKRAKQEERRAE